MRDSLNKFHIRSIRLISIIISISPFINNLLTPRAFNSGEALLDNSFEPVRWIFTGLILIVGSLMLLFLSNKKLSKPETILWCSTILFTFPNLLSIFLGIKPTVSIQWLVLPLAFTSLFFLEKQHFKWFISVGRKVGLFYIYGSLITALIMPSFAIEENYTQGLIFPFRLHGIAALANHLAPMVVLFFVFDILYFKKNKYYTMIHWGLGILVLVFTQSKTTWIALIVAFFLVSIMLLPKYIRIFSLMSVGTLVLTILLFILNKGVNFSIFEEDKWNLLTRATGRDLVWAFAVDLWKRNPWFGYGLDLFKDDYTRQSFYAMYFWTPGQAHNQFFQTLGESGIFGVIGLAFYVIVLIVLSYRYSYRLKFTAFFLVLILLIRGFSEVSLGSNLFAENFLFHFFTFGLLLFSIKLETIEHNPYTES